MTDTHSIILYLSGQRGDSCSSDLVRYRKVFRRMGWRLHASSSRTEKHYQSSISHLSHSLCFHLLTSFVKIQLCLSASLTVPWSPEMGSLMRAGLIFTAAWYWWWRKEGKGKETKMTRFSSHGRIRQNWINIETEIWFPWRLIWVPVSCLGSAADYWSRQLYYSTSATIPMLLLEF